MLSLCFKNNITFDINENNKNLIVEGNILIQEIIGDAFNDPIIKAQMRKRSIMFLEQITTQDGHHLNNWKTICRKIFTKHVTPNRAPEWFKRVEEITIASNDGSRTIDTRYHHYVNHMKGSE